MASPLDPFIEPFLTDPLTGIVLLLLGVATLLGPEALLATFYLRPVLGRRLRKDYQASLQAGEWDPAIERVTGPLKEELAELKSLVGTDKLEARIAGVFTRLEELDAALEARLEELSIAGVEDTLKAMDKALGEHLTNLYDRLEELPGRMDSHLEMAAKGSKGVEMRELYKAANALEEDATEYYEAEVSGEERVAMRLDAMEPSKEYREKHQLGAFFIDEIKGLARDMFAQRRGAGAVTMKRVAGPRSSEFGT